MRREPLTLRPTLLIAPLFGGATASPATVRDSWWTECAVLNVQPRRG